MTSFQRWTGVARACACGWLLVGLSLTAQAVDGPAGPSEEYTVQPWTVFTNAGYTHQFDTDVEDDLGEFSVDRALFEIGAKWSPDRERGASITLGYEHHGYDFDEDDALDDEPWDDVQKLSLGGMLRLGVAPRWMLFVGPSLRWTAETDADLGDGFSGGGLVGAAFRVNNDLAIGPGVVISSELEDGADVVPVLLVDWRINNDWHLRTGRTPTSASAPGVTLTWNATERTDVEFGVAFQKLRFRLDDDDVAPDGVGEESSMPIFVSATHAFTEQLNLSLTAGMTCCGEVGVYDEDGDEIAEEDYDTTGFLGLAVHYEF